jgi:Holliday junction DNA helicase RuvA
MPFFDGAGGIWHSRAVIARLSGVLADKTLDSVLLDVGGVGYQVAVSLNTLAALPAVGQKAQLLTYLHVREDAMQLFGFATPQERKAFELCIAVSGIGPRLALGLLSGLDAAGLFAAVAGDDVARLRKVPGIGPKTAERLVLELRDKVPRPDGSSKLSARAMPSGAAAAGGVFADVAGALKNLGYKPADAERATEQAIKQQPEATIEVIVRAALRLLQRD